MDKEKFLTIPEFKTAVVDSADFGPITLRELTLGERLEFENKFNQENAPSYAALLIVASVIDAGGNRVFDWEDAATIDDLPAGRVGPIAKKARELSALGSNATDTTAVDSAAKNSSATVPAASNG